MKKPGTFHIVIAGNSQSMPFPWNKREENARPDLFTSYWKTYPHVMRAGLQKHTGRDILISSLAFRAATIRDAHNHREHMMRWMSPDVTIFNYGIVDCWPRADGQLVDLSEFENLFSQIVDTHVATLDPPLLIIMGIARSTARKNRLIPALSEEVRKYNNVLAAAHQPERGIHFLDVQRVQTEVGASFLSPDAHHFSNEGHAAIGAQLADLIGTYRPAPPRSWLVRTTMMLTKARRHFCDS
jgi:lysophospholipase L1-like esterase